MVQLMRRVSLPKPESLEPEALLRDPLETCSANPASPACAAFPVCPACPATISQADSCGPETFPDAASRSFVSAQGQSCGSKTSSTNDLPTDSTKLSPVNCAQG